MCSKSFSSRRQKKITDPDAEVRVANMAVARTNCNEQRGLSNLEVQYPAAPVQTLGESAEICSNNFSLSEKYSYASPSYV